MSNSYSRSPVPSTGSYDSSVASVTSPRPGSMYDTGRLRTSPLPSTTQTLPALSMPTGPPMGHNPFQNPYGSSSTTAGPSSAFETMASTSSSSTPNASSQSALSAANLQAQKRAYRQRRKDPSCDACRERKVKCDATETTSCSECSSRNVKCQFTKETNRRMSSIKQVQDLEKQISQIKKENMQLRTALGRQGDTDIDEGMSTASLRLPEIGSQSVRKQRLLFSEGASRAAPNVRNFGRGLFKVPVASRTISSQQHYINSRHDLPPKRLVDSILAAYYSSVHLAMPILHWPSFEHDYNTIYEAGTLHGARSSWAGLFFAVLAVGALFIRDTHVQRSHQGRQFLETSRTFTDFWNDGFVLDDARTALLTSLFLAEINMNSASSRALGVAVKIAHDLRLNCEPPSGPVMEGEMRRRVWWTIYLWDRHLSLELSQPLLIDDEDNDVDLPAAIDDHHIHDNGITVSHGANPATNLLLPAINIARAISQLKKAQKTPFFSPITIATFDSYISACSSSFPPPCQPHSSEPLDPQMLAAVFHVSNARLLLHRHNLSTASMSEVRRTALDDCIQVALDSSHLLARATSSQSPMGSSFGPLASTSTCLHIWRCTLFLLYAGYFEVAMTLIRASMAVGNLREVNIACGRHLVFFLSVLIEKRRGGLLAGSTSYRSERNLDEELIAYVSGDAQASPQNSWIWSEREGGSAVSSPALHGIEYPTTLTEVEAREWGGWERVEYLLGVLAREPVSKMSPHQHTHSRYGSGGSGSSGNGKAPERRSGNERMSITNFI